MKKGGLKEILACYLKTNKDVLKKFNKQAVNTQNESSDDEEVVKPPKKRQRANSNVSVKSG